MIINAVIQSRIGSGYSIAAKGCGYYFYASAVISAQVFPLFLRAQLWKGCC